MFSLEILEKNNNECILILVIYWKKTGLLDAKIYNLFIIETQKIVTATKIIFMVVFTDAGMGIYKFGNNTYPRRIGRRSNLGHIFRGKKCVLWAGKYGIVFIAVDAPVLPNFQLCYLPGIRIMIVYCIAASNASVLCNSNILLTSSWDYNCALCCYCKNNFSYVNCKTRGIIYIHCSCPVF